MEDAECACVSRHQTGEPCLSCSPVGDCDREESSRKTNKNCSVENENCSEDYDWKIPLLDDAHDSTRGNPKAPETGLCPSSEGTQPPLHASFTSGTLPQDSTSSHQCLSASHFREDLTNDTSFSDDREFDFLKAPLLPRSSSFKSRKTPTPGTQTHRKSVRFADALGLELELVRHILNPDEPPPVPSNDLRFLQPAEPVSVVSYWRVCFPQPVASCGDFEHRVLQNKVSLESCYIDNSNRQVYGIVRVANVAYEKNVRVRYSLNGWLTYADAPATYIEHSNDLVTDRFSFELKIPGQMLARSRLEFVVMFSAANQTFWDNNFDRNYALECVEYRLTPNDVEALC